MRLSTKGLALLDNKDIDALLALSYQDLLEEIDRIKVLEVFIKKKLEAETDIEHSIITNLTEACVLSTGYIFSRLTLDTLFLKSKPTCPITAKKLIKNIGGQGVHYVRLPNLDQTISALQSLHHAQMIGSNSSSSRHKAISIDTRSNFLCCHWPSMFGIGRQEIYIPINQMVLNNNDTVGSVQLKISKGILRFKIAISDHSNDYNTIKELLALMLPNGKIESNYYMDSTAFGRCWGSESGNNSLRLDLWYPLQESSAQKGIFNDRRLVDILKHMIKILKLSCTEIDNDIPTCTMAELDLNFKIILDTTPVSLAQMLNCIVTFLHKTATIAEILGYQVNDTVFKADNATPRNTDGRINIGNLHNSVTSTSLPCSR